MHEALSNGANAIGAIRLALATAVLVSHAFPLGGWGTDPVYVWTGGQAGGGTLAVLGFFAISGYLITLSAERGTAARFFLRRGARLLPAYWVALIVVAFVIAPLAWVAQAKHLATFFDFDGNSPFSYVARNALLYVQQWGVNDVFLESTPYGRISEMDSVNGSIWTLVYEAACYLIIGATIVLGVQRFRAMLIPALCIASLVALIVMTAAPSAILPLVPAPLTPEGLRLMPAFLVGSTIAVFRHRVRASRTLAAAAALVVVASLGLGGFWVIGVPALGYLVLWLGYGLPRQLRGIGAKNDVSYGLYLYAWPVQQTTVVLGWNTWGFLAWTLSSLVVSLLFAWASWILVERPVANRVSKATASRTDPPRTEPRGFERITT